MKRVESVTYKGKTIIIVDLSDTIPEENIIVLQEAQKQIATLPPKSALVLTDATNAIYSRATSKALKETAAKNTPFIKASAVVGADGPRSILLTAVRLLAKREFMTFGTREEAMEWLASKAEE